MEQFKLTREEKLKIYTLAKEKYIRNNSKFLTIGMCWCIYSAMIELCYDNFIAVSVYDSVKKTREECFSDFHSLKPKKKCGGYWWKLDNTKIRIKKFDILITQLTEGNQ